MGCVYSSRKILPPSVFKVKYTNDNGNEKYGLMEINAYNLILHKNREPRIIWPLNTVKRYGYNDFMFYFETGRSSPCGQGVFAFRSKEAKDIFNEIKGKSHAGNGTSMARDKSSEVCDYSGQSYSSTHTIDQHTVDEVSSNGLRCINKSNNNTQPLDLLLDPNTAFLPCTSYANILNDNEEDDGDLFNNPFELPKYSSTYTEVEIALCSPKQKNESLPTSPTEILGYTAIDINQTMHLSQKMFKNNVDEKKTLHDSTITHE